MDEDAVNEDSAGDDDVPEDDVTKDAVAAESTARYDPCWYVGGFKGMKASDKAVLELFETHFSLRRPRRIFSMGVHAVWAKWTAVTDLTVADDEGGVEIEITTKARGTGAMVVSDTDAEAVWGVLDQLADLKERFHDRLDEGDGEPGPVDDTDSDESEAVVPE